MPCYDPWKGYRTFDPATGKGGLTANPRQAMNSSQPLTLPCGQCTGCRLDRAESWATRCENEALMHRANSFITLTYDDEHLPDDYSVQKRTLQLFIKRQRFEIAPTPIRYFGCGEYGEKTLRPHYHLIIFGFDYPDKEFHSYSRGRTPSKLFSSKLLNKVWPSGLALIGDVTHQSARYVAGYCMKKITGDLAASHYLRTHPITGSSVQVEPEFALMSRRPGIGSTWFDRYSGDCFPSDFLISNGRHVPVPKFYLLKLNEKDQRKIKIKRIVKTMTKEARFNRTSDRLKVRREVKLSRLSRLKQTL